MAKSAFQYMQEYAADDYVVSEDNGQIVARFTADGVDTWLSFDASDAAPSKRSSCLNWSVRTAMGEDVAMPGWMKTAGLDARPSEEPEVIFTEE